MIANFERQYLFYKTSFDDDAANANNKFPVRTITIFNRLALVLNDDNGKNLMGDASVDIFREFQSGGLLNQVRPPIRRRHRWFKLFLVYIGTSEKREYLLMQL